MRPKEPKRSPWLIDLQFRPIRSETATAGVIGTEWPANFIGCVPDRVGSGSVAMTLPPHPRPRGSEKRDRCRPSPTFLVRTVLVFSRSALRAPPRTCKTNPFSPLPLPSAASMGNSPPPIGHQVEQGRPLGRRAMVETDRVESPAISHPACTPPFSPISPVPSTRASTLPKRLRSLFRWRPAPPLIQHRAGHPRRYIRHSCRHPPRQPSRPGIGSPLRFHQFGSCSTRVILTSRSAIYYISHPGTGRSPQTKNETGSISAGDETDRDFLTFQAAPTCWRRA